MIIKTLEDYLEVTRLMQQRVGNGQISESVLEKNIEILKANFDEYQRKSDHWAVYDKETNTMSFMEKEPV